MVVDIGPASISSFRWIFRSNALSRVMALSSVCHGLFTRLLATLPECQRHIWALWFLSNQLPLMLPLISLSLLVFRSCRHRACFRLVSPKFSSYRLPLPTTILHHRINTISTTSVDSTEYIGQSGRKYKIERVLQEETFPPRHVHLAK